MNANVEKDILQSEGDVEIVDYYLSSFIRLMFQRKKEMENEKRILSINK